MNDDQNPQNTPPMGGPTPPQPQPQPQPADDNNPVVGPQEGENRPTTPLVGEPPQGGEQTPTPTGIPQPTPAMGEGEEEKNGQPAA